MKNILLASTSSLYGQSFLEYILPELKVLYQGCSEIIFIPYARAGGISHDEYTDKVREAFREIVISVRGLHEFSDTKQALRDAQGIFTGGGNTFLLVKELYNKDVLQSLKETVLGGTPYLGTSAGTNIAGLSMRTTNDMPIVYPASFNTLGLVPFNINPHYLDPNPDSKHQGETRQTRIKEFHQFNPQPVVGLREGSWLEVKDREIILKGAHSARIFEAGKAAYELNSEQSLKDLH